MRLWDGQGEVAHLAGEQPLAVAIAVGGALIRAAPMELGTGQGRNLNLQQPWKPRRTISGIRAPAVVPSMSWPSSEAPLWMRGIVCVRFGGTASNRVTDRPTHGHS